jgi:hypothetical protein
LSDKMRDLSQGKASPDDAAYAVDHEAMSAMVLAHVFDMDYQQHGGRGLGIVWNPVVEDV